MDKPRFPVAVVMQRRSTRNRWQPQVWEAWAVLPGYEGGNEPRLLVDEADVRQWLHPGFEVVLYRDEAEGCYLNVSAKEPYVFVMWRMQGDRATPEMVTVSYNEAARWMDGGEQVEGVRMPPELYAWVGEWVEKNFRPEPKKRVKPRSFMHPKDRVG